MARGFSHANNDCGASSWSSGILRGYFARHKSPQWSIHMQHRHGCNQQCKTDFAAVNSDNIHCFLNMYDKKAIHKRAKLTRCSP